MKILSSLFGALAGLFGGNRKSAPLIPEQPIRDPNFWNRELPTRANYTRVELFGRHKGRKRRIHVS